MSGEDYQTCTLVLADGRRVTYTGPVQVEGVSAARVVGVEISTSRRLPPGAAWERVVRDD